MFNSSKNKYYEPNPFTKNKNNKFNKDMQKQIRQAKNEKKNYKKTYKKKGYELALLLIQSKNNVSYTDDSGIIIIKENDLYIVECANGTLDDEEKVRKVFSEYNEVIDYLNKFYNYEKIEEHYKTCVNNIYNTVVKNIYNTVGHYVTFPDGSQHYITFRRNYEGNFIRREYYDWEEW